MDTGQFEGRKREHLRHALDPAHQAVGWSGLGELRLAHEALPDLDLEEVRLESTRFGRPSPVPFYVAGMTAGHADAPELNRLLAVACQERGWAMGVGSQRRELEAAEGGSIDQWSALRREAPRVVLFANLGISQLIAACARGGEAWTAVRELVDSLEAQALFVHANALQEALQPEGTPRFKGAIPALERACRELGVPVGLKETGCGFSGATLRRLRETGLAAIDVSGLGGTHWGRIEGARSSAGSLLAQAAATFAQWGEPTVDSMIAARRELGSGTELWASGGVRTGLDAAKLVALGASQVGFAKPALEAALAGRDELTRWMSAREHELRIALFCTGSASPAALRGNPAAIVRRGEFGGKLKGESDEP
jgi:isopentenyl-diphosphate delta-isomerase